MEAMLTQTISHRLKQIIETQKKQWRNEYNFWVVSRYQFKWLNSFEGPQTMLWTFWRNVCIKCSAHPSKSVFIPIRYKNNNTNFIFHIFMPGSVTITVNITYNWRRTLIFFIWLPIFISIFTLFRSSSTSTQDISRRQRDSNNLLWNCYLR